MVRTIVTLEDADKRWLDRYSGRQGKSTAETIRMAIKEFQKKTRESGYRKILEETSGVLKGGEDSVRFVRKLRKEWT